MNLSFYIAKRYLIAKKSQNAINIISWISVLSVAIGTFALVVVLSAFNGLEDLVESLYESFDGDIRIEAKEGKVFDFADVPISDLQQIEGIAEYSKVLKEICGVRYKKQQSIITLKGVDDSFLSMSELDSSIIDGEAVLKRNDINYAIVGYAIAAQLGLYLEKSPENLSIYAPKRGRVNSVNPMDAVYRRMIATSGVFYISPEYDSKYILAPIDFVRNLLEYDNQVSSIEIKVHEKIEDLESISTQIENILGSDYEVTHRYQFNELIYKTNKTEKWVTFLILVFILIIAAFNILSSLSMLIIEKKKDITTLKSLGATDGLIRRIFFTEGLLINLLGAIVGLTLGVGLCLLQEHVGLVKLEGGIVEYYPIRVIWTELIYILFCVLFIGLATSWYPVRNLTRIKD